MPVKGKIYGHNIENIDLNVCFYCNTPVDEFSRTTDHLIPESRGGIRANKNKVPACGDCNKLKADMTPEEFRTALNMMIHFDTVQYKKRKGYLRKIQLNLTRLIKSRNGRPNK